MKPAYRYFVTLFAAASLHAQAPATARLACEDIARIDWGGVVVNSAVSTPDGPLPMPGPPGAPRTNLQLPAHCLVRATADPRTGASGKTFGIGFELRMPEKWNGKFMFQGGGGTDGAVRPAVGMAGRGETALAGGFAIVSTDAGHQGAADMSFGQDQQARIDYAYRAIDRVTVLAKEMVRRFYGKPADHSYLIGCSNGGRQAMMAAQRFPGDFDGIVAGDPGFRLSYAAVAETWDTQALLSIAPKNPGGQPIMSQAFSNDDLTLVGNAILEACDRKDGLKDGLVDNPGECRFDPAILQCKAGKTAGCLRATQVQALKKIFGGAVNSRQERIYAGWPWDPGIASPAWRAWKVGSSKTAVSDALNVTLGFASLRGYFMTPYDASFDPAKFDFDKDLARVAETAAINYAVATQLTTFAGRGGKLLIYHGMADPVFSASDTIAYYRKLAADNGKLESVRGWARMFLVPGMCHCAGGPALDEFDTLTAIVDWVENGKAPESLLARGASFPGRSRPLCAYPRETRYKGTGSIEEAANFVCK